MTSVLEVKTLRNPDKPDPLPSGSKWKDGTHFGFYQSLESCNEAWGDCRLRLRMITCKSPR